MSWIERLLQHKRQERELDKELRYHMDSRIAELIAEGASPEEAARGVRIEFGGAEQLKEACRDARGTRWVEDFFHDSRYGLRMLRRSPLFTSVAILSLALGIGACTAIFSLTDRVMFRKLPVREPERLVQIGRFHPPYGRSSMSYPLLQALGNGLTNFEGLLAHHHQGTIDITIDGNLETADFDLVSGSYYPLLGVNAVTGRVFAQEVDRIPGANPVAVISHHYWERRFASDAAVIGKTFRRLNTVFTIVGVTPREFFGTSVGEEPDITVPLTMDSEVRGGKSWLPKHAYAWLRILGRLKPGVPMSQARAEVEKVFANAVAAEAAFSDSERGRREMLSEYVELQAGGSGFDELRLKFQEPLLVLMGIVGLVLLLACANLANLLLAKSAGRQREISMRLALGAGRGRVVRQLLAEGLLLAFSGGTLGLLLAYGFDEWLVSRMSNGGPRLPLDVIPDGRILLFAIGASLSACIMFSLAPALQAMRQTFQPALAEIRAGRWRMGKGLIVAQMAISVLLLIAAGLFGRTLVNIYRLDPGFDRHGVVLFSTNAERLGYTRERIRQMQTRVPTELATLPGIQSASNSMFPPISGGGWDGSYNVEGHTPTGREDEVVHLNAVGVDFFKTFRTPVLLGREFNERDTAASPPVVVVNQSFARQYFGDRSPIGKWVSPQGSEPNPHYTIVGVVKDVKYESLRGDSPRTIYLMSSQFPPEQASDLFSVRMAAGGMASTVSAINVALARFDAALKPLNLISMDDHVAHSILQERMLATLAGFFAAQALLLSSVGIYGMMAFQVTRRRREIGIRMALGADAWSVIGMVLRQTARLTLVGGVLGALGGLALTRGAQTLLFGIRASDPPTFLAAILGLLLIALAAAYLPGRSAARTNPLTTLRAD